MYIYIYIYISIYVYSYHCLLPVAHCLLPIACCPLPLGDLRLPSALIKHQAGPVAQLMFLTLFTLNGQDELLSVFVRFSDCIAQEFDLIFLGIHTKQWPQDTLRVDHQEVCLRECNLKDYIEHLDLLIL